MNAFLFLLVLLKGFCLLFCWKAIKVSRNKTQKSDVLLQSEVLELEKRVKSAIELNHNLTNEFQRIKREKTS